MKHKKVTCFTSVVLTALMALSPVVSYVPVMAEETDSETNQIKVEETETDDITVEDEIVVEETEESASEITVESEETMSASVEIGEVSSDEIQVTESYAAGDAIPLHIQASNPTEEDQTLVLSFWKYEEALPDDMSGLADVLTERCSDVSVTEFADAESVETDLVGASDVVESEWVLGEEDITVQLPAGTRLDDVLHVEKESAGTVTAQVAFGEELDAVQPVWEGSDITVESEDSEIVVESDTEETESETPAIVVEDTDVESFGSVYVGDSVQNALTELNASDFASMRLVLMTDDPEVISNDSDVIGVYENIYLLQFTSIQQTMNAYAYYKDKVLAVEPDVVVEAADETKAQAEAEIAMTEEENPVAMLNEVEASEAVQDAHGVIALIDTGVSEHANVIDRVSVIDEVLEGNGHGDAMLESIVGQDVEARVLSIRAMDDNGFGTISSLVAAMEYAIEQKVDVINLSVYAQATLSTSVLEQEIVKATNEGILVVGAAGNDGADVAGYVPGNVEEAWIIGAADETGARRTLSNYGETVDYNVFADSTSAAAATFTGYISANGLDAVADVLNQGLIFETDFVVVEQPDDSKDEDFSKYTLDESKKAMVRYTFVDETAIKEGDTINSLYEYYLNNTDEDAHDVFIGTIVGGAQMYDAGDGTYKFKANTPFINGVADTYLEAIFAHGNNNGEAVTEGVSMDLETGIATVDADVLQKEEDDFADIQAQVMIPINPDKLPYALQTITVVNADGSVSKIKREVQAFMNESIPLAIEGSDEELTSDDFTVYVNGTEGTTTAEWDNEKHTLTLPYLQAGLISELRIEVNKSVDSVFEIAWSTADRGMFCMFYLPETVNPDVLYVGQTVSARTKVSGNSASDYSADPPPATIIGGVTKMSENSAVFDGGDWLGYMGFPRDLFGVSFRCGHYVNGQWVDYGVWTGDPNDDTSNINGGIHAMCHHVHGSASWRSGWQTGTYKIIDKWTSGQYTYFALDVLLTPSAETGTSAKQSLGGQLVFGVKNAKGGLSVQKTSSDTTISGSDYTYQGAKFTIYDANWKAVTTITTNANGVASTGDEALDAGTYYVKETTAPKGYHLDSSSYLTFKINGGEKASSNQKKFANQPKTGQISVLKFSDNPDMTEGNNCYTLGGSVYGIFTDEACTKAYTNSQQTGTATTVVSEDVPNQAVATFTYLAFGTYYIKEIKAPTGFALNPSVVEVTIDESNSSETEPMPTDSEEPSHNDPATIMIDKIWDGEETATIPTLEGTQFTVWYYDGFFEKENLPDYDTFESTAKRKWVLEVQWDEVVEKYWCQLSDTFLVDELSDDLYRDPDTNAPVVPRGTLVIQETLPASGYTLNGFLMDKNGNKVSADSDIFVTQVRDPENGNGPVAVLAGNEYHAEDTPIYGMIRLKKYDSDGKTPLAGVTFTCVGDTVGDVGYTVTTDENGEAVFKDLYPDVYTITETETTDGHELLRDPLVVEVPTRVSQEYVDEYNIDVYNTVGVAEDGVRYDAADDIYYIHNFTYEITNDANFQMPMSGSVISPTTFVPLMSGVGILGGLGFVGLRRKKKK